MLLHGGNLDKLALANSGNYAGQFWKIEKMNNEYYRITNGWQITKSLDSDSNKKGNLVAIMPSGNQEGQFWKITEVKTTVKKDIDSDGDGLTDNLDRCPNKQGTMANQGCPEKSTIRLTKINEYARAIYFNSGKSSFRPGVTDKLDLIVVIFNEYPDYKFTIEAHTDSAGKSSSNLKLSDSRARAVKDYFIKKGINPFRLTANGFGKDYPIASNKTRSGRAQNRRIEIKLKK